MERKIEFSQTQNLFAAPYGASKTHGTVAKIDKREVLNTNIAQNVEMRKLSHSDVFMKRLPFLAFALIAGILCVHASPTHDIKGFIIQLIASAVGAYTVLEARFNKGDLLLCIAFFAVAALYLAINAPFYSFAVWSGSFAITFFVIILKFTLGQEYKNTYYLPERNYHIYFQNQNLNEIVYYIVAVVVYVLISFLKMA
jgi:hypothetical protein